MPTVRLPGIPDVQRAAYSGAAPADESAKYAGQAALGDAVGNVGQAVHQFQQQSRRAKAAGDLAKGRLARHKAEADLQLKIEKDPDYNNWERYATESVGEMGNAFIGEEVASGEPIAPVVRQQLEQEFLEFQQKTISGVRNQALRARNTDTDKAMSQLGKLAYEQGDYEQGDEITKQRLDLGLITHKEAALQQREGRKYAEFQLVNRGISVDPIGTLDRLTEVTEGGNDRYFKNLDENTRRSLVVEARREVSAQRSETIRGLMDRRADNEVIEDTELQGLVDDRLLTPQQKKLIQNEQSRSGDDPAVMNAVREAYDAADNYDPSSDPTKERQVAIEAQFLQLPPLFRERAMTRLNRAMRPGPKSTRASVANDFFKQEFNARAYGETIKEAGVFVDPESASRASHLMLSLQDEMEGWLEDNPGATRLEVRQKAEEISAAALNQGKLNSVTEGRIVIQGGVSYRFTGGDPSDPANYAPVE
jgi:hypothetical protein